MLEVRNKSRSHFIAKQKKLNVLKQQTINVNYSIRIQCEHRLLLEMLTQDAAAATFLKTFISYNLIQTAAVFFFQVRSSPLISRYSPGHTLLTLWAAELYGNGRWIEESQGGSGCPGWGSDERTQICQRRAASSSHRPPRWRDAEAFYGPATHRLESKIRRRKRLWRTMKTPSLNIIWVQLVYYKLSVESGIIYIMNTWRDMLVAEDSNSSKSLQLILMDVMFLLTFGH